MARGEGRKPTINTAGLPQQLARVLEPIKQSIEMITGAKSREIKGLNAAQATQVDIVAKLNEVIARINASGEY